MASTGHDTLCLKTDSHSASDRILPLAGFGYIVGCVLLGYRSRNEKAALKLVLHAEMIRKLQWKLFIENAVRLE